LIRLLIAKVVVQVLTLEKS